MTDAVCPKCAESTIGLCAEHAPPVQPTWTVLTLNTECGRCRVAIAAGEPIAYLPKTRKWRCASCLQQPVDWNQIELERWRLEKEAALAQGPAGSSAAPVVRLPPIRRPSRLSELAAAVFDPKSAAAGDGGDS